MNPEQQHADPYFAARCYRHPDRETNVSCTRCERPICTDCLRDAAVGFQCPECTRSARSSVRTPTLPYGGRLARSTAAVTIMLGTLNVVAYLITAFTSSAGVRHNSGSELFDRLVLVPDHIAVTGEYWRFLGSAFLHDGLLHVAVNMISLAVLGPSIERVFGPVRFAVLYLVAALGGAVAVFAFGAANGPVVGASAAIFGLFGAMVVLYRKLGLDMRALLPTVLINVYITYQVPNISWIAHLGGVVAGALVAAVLVYAPRARRLLVQVSGVAAVLAVMAGLVLWRAHQLGAY